LEGLIFTDEEHDVRQRDLRSSATPWATPRTNNSERPRESFKCDILVVGAGITGALVAESLTRQGRSVVIIDRETPGRGSTYASTAMLLWEIDRSLSQLTQLYGFDRAARCYRASLQAVTGLMSLVSRHHLSCHMRIRPSLYCRRRRPAFH
jgi:glycine/D-amino acid oxidase-like deaminating enzyme